MSELVRVVIGEDDVLLREGIARLLTDAGFEVVGQAGDAEDFLRKALAHKPDVAVVDIQMPPGEGDDGLRAALELRERRPETGILVLSAHVEVDRAMDLLTEGDGVGYLLKSRVTEPDEFLESVERVAGGGSVIDPALVRELVGANRVSDPLDELTPRERDVLQLMAAGRSNAGIARSLWVAEGTVEKHVRSILGKLGLAETADDHRRVLAVVAYLEAQ